MTITDISKHPIILFDGICNLCSKSVQFVIERDTKDLFRFASLQSDVGQSLLQQYNLPKTEMGSFVLVENNKAYTRSTGALQVAKRLSGMWPLLYSFMIIPPFIRDAVYNFIAAHRYQWFGKQEACWLPSPALKNKFL